MAEENTQSVESTVREIRRKTRKKYSAEEKLHIVLEGLRGEDSISELCRREGIHQNMYYKWSKEFLEAGYQALVLQYSLASIPFCLLGHTAISSLLDTDPRQLAQKGSLPHRPFRFHRRFCSYLTQKGHSRTLFACSLFLNLP